MFLLDIREDISFECLTVQVGKMQGFLAEFIIVYKLRGNLGGLIIGDLCVIYTGGGGGG